MKNSEMWKWRCIRATKSGIILAICLWAEDEAKEGRRGYWKEYKELVKVGDVLCLM